MRYSVQLRMNGASGSKFLIDSWPDMEFMDAFHRAADIAEKLEKDHFVEIVPEENTGEAVAVFN